MSNIKESQLRGAIRSAREFIENVNAGITKSREVANAPARWDKRMGQLMLSTESLNRESDIVDALHDAVRGKQIEVWSRPGVEKQFTTALHSALGIYPHDEGDFANRQNAAIEELNNSLRVPLREWQFIFPILGLRVLEEPFVIANLNFCRSTEANLDRLCEHVDDIVRESLHTEAEKEDIRRIYREQIDRVFTNTTLATVTVTAAEKQAAKHLAYQDLLEVVDILNYFSIALYPTDLRVSIRLPAESRGGRQELMSFETDEKFSMDFTNEGPIQDFDLSEIDDDKSTRIGLSRIKELMSKPAKSELDRSIIAAARIAGKAQFAVRREDAFLLFAIALESLIVGGNEKTDLTYKLSARCAHLLGDNLQTRIRIRDMVKKLYGIRSGIVHRGQASFPDSDLKILRSFALRTVRAILTNDELQRIEKKADLEAWFENRMLS